MKSEFEAQNQTEADFQGDLPPLKTGHANQLTGVINMQKRDRFELLSAYLDGEVTAAEKRQVEEWLACDPAVQKLYTRLLKLRQGLRTIPVTPQTQPVEKTIDQVYARIERRSHRTKVWGGAAIAALLVGALSNVIPSREFIAPQLVRVPEPVTAPAETLMVTLNTPVVEIPKAAVASPENVDGQTWIPQNDTKDNVH